MAKKKLSWKSARHYYRKIRQRSEAESPEKFDAEILRLLDGLPFVLTTPELWFALALKAQFTCRRCQGSGRYNSPIASGICFRCEGKTYQNDQDVVRNEYYDRLNRTVHERYSYSP